MDGICKEIACQVFFTQTIPFQTSQLPDVFILNIRKGYTTISLLYIIKYVMIALGFVVMGISLLMVIYLERLWCFAKCGKVISIGARNGTEWRSKVSTINVNDENLNSSVGRRNAVQGSWQFQN